MTDTRAIKPEDDKGGTFTQQLTVAEVTTAYVSPVPSEAPGVITAEPGTVNEEAIYFKTKDAGAGTISGLTRDYTNLNGGTGIQHENSEDWEIFQNAFYVKNLVDALTEGYLREQQTVAKVDADEFTVVSNVAAKYTTGRIVRFNEDNTKIAIVVTSSYSAGTGLTTVQTVGVTVPTLTSVEIGLQPKTATNLQSIYYAEDTGAADAYVVTIPAVTTDLLVGMRLVFKASAANTGASTIAVNGGTAIDIIKDVSSALEADDILEDQVVFVVYDGTSFQIIGSGSVAVATAAEVVTGTDNAKMVTPLAAAPYANSSLFRQAIINGNFDVWQRGTSVALTTADGYTADRWYAETTTATTDKTISRQDGTGVNGSYYCARFLAAQDVDALNTFSQALESQDSIKFRGQKVTLSFYARGGAEFVADNATLVSKIVTGKGTDQKVLAFTTSADGVSQNNTLTTSWVKFTCTTTNVIASDITQIGISFAFTHAGSGVTTNYFEVTQVQLCAGSVALPFQPKSFEDELRACQRYYQLVGKGAVGRYVGSSLINVGYQFPVEPRITSPTPTLTTTTPVIFRTALGADTGSASAITSNGGGWVQISGLGGGATNEICVMTDNYIVWNAEL